MATKKKSGTRKRATAKKTPRKPVSRAKSGVKARKKATGTASKNYIEVTVRIPKSKLKGK